MVKYERSRKNRRSLPCTERDEPPENRNPGGTIHGLSVRHEMRSLRKPRRSRHGGADDSDLPDLHLRVQERRRRRPALPGRGRGVYLHAPRKPEPHGRRGKDRRARRRRGCGRRGVRNGRDRVRSLDCVVGRGPRRRREVPLRLHVLPHEPPVPAFRHPDHVHGSHRPRGREGRHEAEHPDDLLRVPGEPDDGHRRHRRPREDRP
ncbi:hypothetical protein SDC9_146872 [bioreactor metagenome]|uniref:Uncharacterized protein n=1 Tax=bioreactor metagenome TaxID=1076179 RepID=A0A645EEY3_9ZZZZ